ncbi:MAG: T9SS type A sorting domain-containing protein, partial [Flavobacteriales bacterium]|nr:T9SS type A sorting domain-containing protein [Flavobacteriales bacterium]
ANASLDILHLYILSGSVSGTGGIQVLGGGTLTCTGGSIVAGCVVSTSVTTVVTFNAPTVFYNYGSIIVGGPWNHVSGSLHGNGSVTVLSTAVVTITGVWDPYDSWQNALVCHGAISVNVPIAFAFTGQVDVEVTGVVTVVNGVLWTYGFNNGGTLVCLGSSVLRISGGVFVHEMGGTTSTAGIILAGGTLIAQAPLDILHFWLEGGTLQGPQPVNVITGGTFTWTGGTIHASCVLNLAVGVVSVFNTTVSVYCYGAIYNGGTWNFNGGNLIGNGAFHNLATGVFTINGVLDIDFSWELVFYNAGIVNKGTALVFTHYGGAFYNLTGGVVNVLVGEYRFKGGYFNHGSIVTTGLAELCGCGGTFTNENGGEATNGRVVIRDGSLVVNWAFNVKHFKLDTGGQVFGPFELKVIDGGTFVWIGGTIEASAIIDLAINVVTTFNPVASVFCHGVIHHRGTWNFNGGDLKGDGTFHNYLGAIVYINGVLDVDLSWRLLVYNAGEFRKVAGGIFTHYATYFHNLVGGLVHIVDGEYRFKGGFYNYGSITYNGLGKLCGCGGTFYNENGGEASNGRVVIRNASLIVNWAFDVKHVELEDGAQVFGPLEVKVIDGGTFKWIGGTIEASAIVDLAINVVTTFNPVASVFCHGVIHHHGTWNFNGGDLKGDGTFHNYLGAIVYIYGALDVDLSWRLLVYNAGEFRKMNGGIFTHYATYFHNLAGSLVHIVDGEYRFKGGFYNYGSITYAGLGKLCGCGGTFYNENGGEASNGRVVIRNASLVVNWDFDVKHFELEDGAQVFGPFMVKVINGGTFKWIGGTIEASAIIDIAINVITTFNPTVGVFCHGVIHHRGTWNFEGGKLWGGGVFNNLSAGLILITGTSDPADSWRVALNNAGIYRMNCGCAFRHWGGAFTNLTGGKLEVLQGTLLIDDVFVGDQYGEILVALGATLNLSVGVDWRGSKAICHGLLQCPDFRFKGTAAQEMGGDGTFTHIRIDNSAGVDLSGHVKVSITIVLVNGHVRCGDYHITLQNPLVTALVGGGSISRFVCDGLGSFRRAISGNGCFYPVGTSTKYCPITLSMMSGPQDICGVRVRPSVSTSYGAVGIETGTTVASHVVGCAWVLDEASVGGNTYDATLQWEGVHELTGFTNGNCAVAHYTVGGWVPGSYGPASGTDPYTKVIIGLIDPREICVADPAADLGGDAVDCLGVPGGSDLPGTPCDDGDSGTTDDTWTAECDCEGTPVVPCTTDLDFVYQADGAHSLTWTIHEQGTNTPVQSGGGMLIGNGSEQTCVPDGCYYLVVTDGGGDGIVGGGYLLKVNSAARLIDNLYGAFGEGGFTSGSTSQIDGNEGFCIPVGTDRLIFTSCDKRDWRLSPCGGEYMVTTDNAAVSAEYGGPNAATSGYQMWWFKPNGGYSFKRFQSHATSNGMPASATRACHFKLNAWAGNALQEGGFYNVRVRGRVNGAYNAWGPACRMVVSSVEAQCPRTKLMDIPGNAYLSCGQMRDVGTNVLVHARPVKRMNAACSWVSANRYQFRFRIPSENITIVKTGALGAGNYFVNTNGLACGKTYEVEVRASFDGGSTWCHGNADPNVTSPLWGDACLLTITCGSGMAQEEDVTTALSEARMAMYPNPNRGDQLFLGLSGLEPGVGSVNVDIFDSFGKRVAQHTLGVLDGFVSSTINLNGELSNGMYVVTITAGDAILIERLVVQN